jgi:hypothetical protein
MTGVRARDGSIDRNGGHVWDVKGSGGRR